MISTHSVRGDWDGSKEVENGLKKAVEMASRGKGVVRLTRRVNEKNEIDDEI